MKTVSMVFFCSFVLALLSPAHLVCGDPLFDAPEKHPLGSVSEPVVITDFSGDGLLDIAVANTGKGTGVQGIDTVSVLVGTAAGQFARAQNFPVGDRPEGIAVARVNADEFPDILAANLEGNTVAVLLGNGAGGFAPASHVAVDGGPRWVAVGDWNADGVIDMATANYAGDTATVFLGDGLGGFLAMETHSVGNAPEMLASGRLNDDEAPDLITCNSRDNSVTPLFNLGNGRFTRGLAHRVGLHPRFLLTTDLDGNGLDDLMVANRISDAISLELNLGDGGFVNAGSLSPGTSDMALRGPSYIAIADMTGDGALDLLATWAENDTFTIFPRTSNIQFRAPLAYATGHVPVGIAAADLDGDGAGDVVVTNALEDSCSIFRTSGAASGIIVDDGSPGTSRNGAWLASQAPFPYGGTALFSKDGSRYTWQATLPAPGIHEVLMWWTVNPRRATAIPVGIAQAGGETGVLVDQTRGTGVWNSLGTFAFGTSGQVTLTVPRGEASASADAVRFRPRRDLLSPTRRGSLAVTARAQPASLTVAAGQILAFQGTLRATEEYEAENWKAAIVVPVGSGRESERIAAFRLHIDRNGNKALDPQDSQLGDAFDFGSDLKATTILGFNEMLEPGVAVDFFITCDMIGDGPTDLQVELAGILASGVATNEPSTVTGLPLRGWLFPTQAPGGLQLPSDATQDGHLNLSDPLLLLRILFHGAAVWVPCGDGTLDHSANVGLFDANGDLNVDLTDAIVVLTYLFGGGHAPVLGTACITIQGCPDNALRCGG